MPVKEYRILDTKGEEAWVNEKVLDGYLKSGYSLDAETETRMAYAIPSWVPTDGKETILLLDDFRRKY